MWGVWWATTTNYSATRVRPGAGAPDASHRKCQCRGSCTSNSARTSAISAAVGVRPVSAVKKATVMSTSNARSPGRRCSSGMAASVTDRMLRRVPVLLRVQCECDSQASVHTGGCGYDWCNDWLRSARAPGGFESHPTANHDVRSQVTGDGRTCPRRLDHYIYIQSAYANKKKNEHVAALHGVELRARLAQPSYKAEPLRYGRQTHVAADRTRLAAP